MGIYRDTGTRTLWHVSHFVMVTSGRIFLKNCQRSGRGHLQMMTSVLDSVRTTLRPIVTGVYSSLPCCKHQTKTQCLNRLKLDLTPNWFQLVSTGFANLEDHAARSEGVGFFVVVVHKKHIRIVHTQRLHVCIQWTVSRREIRYILPESSSNSASPLTRGVRLLPCTFVLARLRALHVRVQQLRHFLVSDVILELELHER